MISGMRNKMHLSLGRKSHSKKCLVGLLSHCSVLAWGLAPAIQGMPA